MAQDGMSHSQENKVDVEQILDLGLYIENLFTKVEHDTESVTLIETELLEEFSYTEEQIISQNEVVLEEQTLEEVKSESQEKQLHVSENDKSQIPAWAQETFECLLVKLAGMNVIVPALSVAFIERVNKSVTRIPFDNDAFKGILTLRGKSVAIIDLFNLISENTLHANEQDMRVDKQHIDHVMVMEDGYYALACDDVKQMLTLNKDEVRWNRESFNNPMFSGVVTEYLCPLLNIDTLYQQVAAMPFVQSLKTVS